HTLRRQRRIRRTDHEPARRCDVAQAAKPAPSHRSLLHRVVRRRDESKDGQQVANRLGPEHGRHQPRNAHGRCKPGLREPRLRYAEARLHMTQPNIFDAKVVLPDAFLAQREKTLLGFETRYKKIHEQLRLLLSLAELASWSKKCHGQKL